MPTNPLLVILYTGTQTTKKLDEGDAFVGFQHRYFWENTPSCSFENDDEAKLVLN